MVTFNTDLFLEQVCLEEPGDNSLNRDTKVMINKISKHKIENSYPSVLTCYGRSKESSLLIETVLFEYPQYMFLF